MKIWAALLVTLTAVVLLAQNLKTSGLVAFGPIFTYATGSFASFTLTSGNLNGGVSGSIPLYSGSYKAGCPAATNLPIVGYQNAVFIDGTVIYLPWGVQAGGGLSCVPPHGVLMTYTPATGAFNSNASSQWQWTDLRTLTDPHTGAAYNAGGNCALTDTVHDCPGGYNSLIADTANHNIYLLPDAKATGPVVAMIHTTGGVGSFVYSFADISQIFSGGTTGWSIGAIDTAHGLLYFNPTNTNEKFVQYATANNTSSGTVLNPTTGWTGFDPVQNACTGGDGFVNLLNPFNEYTGTLGMVIVNNRFVYSIPTSTANVMAIFDSGAAGTNNLRSCANWKALVLSNLGKPGYPSLTGAAASQVFGFAGGVLATTTAGGVQDTVSGTVYLYMIPWSVSRGTGASQQSSLACRVQVGHYVASAFSYDDPTLSTATWSCFDLSSLANNINWTIQGLLTPPVIVSQGSNQSALSGYQLGDLDAASFHVIFAAANSPFFVTHDPNRALSDVAGWAVVPNFAHYSNNTYGFAHDTTNRIIYPAPYQSPADGFSGRVVLNQFTLPSGI